MPKSVVFGARSTADQVIAGIDLTGKCMVVTGCSSGIGYETMSALAANGAHVIGLAPTFSAAERACKQIEYRCTPVECDLSDLDSVAAAAAEISQMTSTIDALIVNAGIALLPHLSTRYGVERQFLVNHVGHFALVNGLLERMRDASGRIVIVGDSRAIAHSSLQGIMFDNLAAQRGYDPTLFYAQSKLAAALYSKELARRLRPRGISVNTVDPGRVRGTRLLRELSWPRKVLRAMASVAAKSPAQGAATSVLLAASPTVAGNSGENWMDCKASEAHPLEHDFDLARRLWQLTEAIISVGPAAEVAVQEAA